MNGFVYIKVAALSPVGAYIAFVAASLIFTGKPNFVELIYLFIAGGYVASFIAALILGLPYLIVQNSHPVNLIIWLPPLLCLGSVGGYFINLGLFGSRPSESFMTHPGLFMVSGSSAALMAWLLLLHMHRSFKTSMQVP